MYQESATGVNLPVGDPTIFTRWLFMMAGGILFAGLWLIWPAGNAAAAENDRHQLARAGGWLVAPMAVVQVLLGAAMPYVVGRQMFSNGMRVSSVAAANRDGYLEYTLWLRTNVRPEYARGEAMFRGQCMSCHTVDGYRSIQLLLNGRNRASIGNLLTILHDYKTDSPYRKFMPPLAGTDAEVQLLGDYLDHLENGPPASTAFALH